MTIDNNMIIRKILQIDNCLHFRRPVQKLISFEWQRKNGLNTVLHNLLFWQQRAICSPAAPLPTSPALPDVNAVVSAPANHDAQ